MRHYAIFSAKGRKRLRRRLRRFLLAEYRDFRILLRECWLSIAVFAVVLLGGGYLLAHFYHPEKLSYDKAVYAIFMMVFFQNNLKLPDEWYLQIIFYVVPLLGLGVIVEGFTRFGMLVINKKLRGEVWQRIVSSTYSEHIVLCGLGHIGYRVAEQLLRMGKEFVVVAQDSQFVAPIRREGVPVLLGDARDTELLESANVKYARTIIIVTDNDLANLDIAITARERNPKIRTVVRLFDAELGKKIQKTLGIDMAFSTSTLTAPAVALGALSPAILHSFYVGKELLSMAELALAEGCPWMSKSLESFESARNVTVVCHRSGDTIRFHPKAEDVLLQGDVLLFLANLETVEKLQTEGFYHPASSGLQQMGSSAITSVVSAATKN